jgi:hypothetical protein
MSAPKLLFLALLLTASPALARPEAFKSHDATLYEDELSLVDRPFDAAGYALARKAWEALPSANGHSDDVTVQLRVPFRDALLHLATYYEQSTYQLYPYRPLDRAAALRFAAPMLAKTPFAKGLPAKPSKSTPRFIDWSMEQGAVYDLIFALNARGQVIKITLDWGV